MCFSFLCAFITQFCIQELLLCYCLGVPKVSKEILFVEYCVENILLYLCVHYMCFRCMTSLCKKHEKLIFTLLEKGKKFIFEIELHHVLFFNFQACYQGRAI